MPKKRRKLSKEMEEQINKSEKKVELIKAKINDIREEDIQNDYLTAFHPPEKLLQLLKDLYKNEGFNDQTHAIYNEYTKQLSQFEEEYEL